MNKQILRSNPYHWAALFAASLLAYLILPQGEYIQQFAALPLVGSLVGLLIRIALNEAAYQRELMKLAIQNNFSLAATSHMAGVAFDKHVEFSERYAAETYRSLVTLFRKGPTNLALDHSQELFAIRREFAVWLTKDIDTKLEGFESALREVGASAEYVYNNMDAEDRQGKLTAMYRTFAQVIGLAEWNNEQLTDERAATKVIQQLRIILGTEEFTRLRLAIVVKATDDLG